MKNKISFAAAITYIFVAMTLTFSLTMMVSSKIFEERVASVDEKEKMYQKISDIDKVIRKNYYTQIDDSQVLENMSAGYLKGLGDPESKYYTSGEVAEYQLRMEGKIIGIGVDLKKSKEDGGYMKVSKVYTDSPADVQGIVRNDNITAINGESTVNMSLEKAEELLSNVSGTSVNITYTHENAEQNVDLIHKAYDAPSLSYSNEAGTGYLKITAFTERTASEIDYAVKNLTEAGAKNLVIDIRNVNNKDFDSAAKAADVLLKEGTTMNAIYNDGEKRVLYTSDKSSTDLPIVLIINENTGYSAEMFATMIKDVAGAKTVGAKTMGKGTFQKMFRLPDGSGVELTVATFSPVASEVYYGIGIVPDYEKELAPTEGDVSISTDTQIQRAIEVANNLTNTSEKQ